LNEHVDAFGRCSKKLQKGERRDVGVSAERKRGEHCGQKIAHGDVLHGIEHLNVERFAFVDWQGVGGRRLPGHKIGSEHKDLPPVLRGERVPLECKRGLPVLIESSVQGQPEQGKVGVLGRRDKLNARASSDPDASSVAGSC